MSLLRRVAVVSKQSQIHAVAQELANEVFAADDLSEASEIIAAVSPDLIVFEGAFAPAHLRACLAKAIQDSRPSPATVVIPAGDGPFSDEEYRQAGIVVCPAGEGDYTRLREVAAAVHETAQQQAAGRSDTALFLDETAAAVTMAGRSPAMARTLQMIKLVAASRCNPLLIVGDTGTGKEVAARAVHVLRHPNEPFVAVNCAALTASLLESELFGHVKGSFTSADRDKTGLLETAGAGTIFLDEISEMPLELQAKLLRILQERVFRKVGGVKDIECRATIIASSNRDLKKEVREKRFRQDLYYRLNVIELRVPPLRERREDIGLLANAMLRRLAQECGDSNARLHPEALAKLESYRFPGNVRELENMLERAYTLCEGDEIKAGDLRLADSPGLPENGDASLAQIDNLEDHLEEIERKLIMQALEETRWNRTAAAQRLGLTFRSMRYRLKKLGLD